MSSPAKARALLVLCVGAGFGAPAAADTGPPSEQSPINIVTADVVWQPTWPMIGFHYPSNADVSVLNVDAPSVEGSVRVTPSTPATLEFDTFTYDLLQFHFHLSAEHAVDGYVAPKIGRAHV